MPPKPYSITKLDNAQDIARLDNLLTRLFKSTMLKATQIFNSSAGPLPLSSTSLQTNGGTLLISASGSGYGSAGSVIGMDIAIDGVTKGSAKVYVNEGTSHRSFVTSFLAVTGIAAGAHTIALSAISGTSSDANDFFTCTVFEFQ